MEDNGILLICKTTRENKLAANSQDLLAIGSKLAVDSKLSLSALVIGHNAGNAAGEIASIVDNVYVADAESLIDYQPDPFTSIVYKLIKQSRPKLILLEQSVSGSDLAPRLAAKLNTVAVMDCIDISFQPEKNSFLATRPVYGGNALAAVTTGTSPQVCTIKAKSMTASAPDKNRKGQITDVDTSVETTSVKTRIIQKVRDESTGIKVEDASRIITGGRGMGSIDGFKQLEKIAGLLKGAVGATRPACDNGWAPDSSQIGMTSKIVAPDLYIAVALSGASTHVSGFSGSKTIVAINKDPEANIFKYANYGVVGEWEQVLPAFADELGK